MDAMPFDTPCEEEQLWTAAIEADQQIGREWLRRAELIARARRRRCRRSLRVRGLRGRRGVLRR